MFGLSPIKILLIIVIILVLFGASRLPQLGKSLGEGLRNLKRGLSDDDDRSRRRRRREDAGDGERRGHVAEGDQRPGRQRLEGGRQAGPDEAAQREETPESEEPPRRKRRVLDEEDPS